MSGIEMVDFILLTPTLSSRRGGALTMQLIVFMPLKTCVDTYTLSTNNCFIAND